MKELRELANEIQRLTLEIEQKYPELYPYLDENPTTLPNLEHPQMNGKTLEDYLETLEQLISHHKTSHKGMAGAPPHLS